MSTEHARKSPRNEVRQETIDMLTSWVKDMLNEQSRAIVDDKYNCRIEMKNNKMAEFVISRLTDHLDTTDIIRFVVCRHSRNKKSGLGVGWRNRRSAGRAVLCSKINRRKTHQR